MMYSVMTQAYSEKEIPSSPNRSQTYDLPITSSDTLPLSYRRLVGAKAIKLGSCDKHVLFCCSTQSNSEKLTEKLFGGKFPLTMIYTRSHIKKRRKMEKK